jgi:hypothetical protein
MPTPAITKPSNHFNATLYTGTGTNAVGITGVGFQTDFNWTKSRSSASYTHQLSDSVRGFSQYLYSSATTTEGTDASNHIQSVNSDGYVINSGASFNASGVTFVSWNWKAGGTAVTNTSGTISSQVSANPTAGFSVVTYTSTTGTVGHGLGVTPSMIIMKPRNNTDQWTVGHASLNGGSSPWNYGLPLNDTAATQTNSGFWNNTAPTSTVFSQGSWNSGYTKVAYCWAAVPGYSAFGSYTGNGSTDGPFVYTGFRPRWLLLKNTGGVASWYCLDSSRNTYNVEDAVLVPNTTGAEVAITSVDFLSNGFKLRTTTTDINGSGTTYIYACFAEAPFKFSNGR